jgi:polar amino acid transport system substrate-binding protein
MRTRLFAVRIQLFAALSVLLVLVSAALRAAPPTTLKLVSDVWPPFTDVEGKPREAIELVKAALARGGVQARFSIVTWSAAVEAIESGKADGSAAMWKTPEREKYLVFSKPYLENRLVLVGRKGEPVGFTKVSELGGKRLALTKGYAYGESVTRAPGVQLVVKNSDADCLRAVLSKQADYVLLDQLLVRHLFDFHASKAGGLIEAGDVPLVRYPLYFALRKDHPQATQIIADFDKNVERMKADGTYNIVLNVPWIRADVDGDGVAEYVGSKKTTSKAATDPSASKVAYPVFVPENAVPNMTRSPGYVIDGKSYNTWGDAATTIERTGPTKPQGIYKYSTGVVLFEF